MYGRSLGAHETAAPRFRLIARGLFSGRIVGTYTWEWDAEFDRYRPEAEPWNMWEQRAAEARHVRIAYTLSGFSRLAAGLQQGTYIPAA